MMATDIDDMTRRLPQGAATLIAALGKPLDFIAGDHRREREVCALIDSLVATSAVDTKTRIMMRDFLSEDLPQHFADEELDLFPLMIMRCDTHEDIEAVISRLKSDHVQAQAEAPEMATLIDAGDAALSPAASSRLSEYARLARQHLVVENAIILPLARAHLTNSDLKRMTRHMLERRGLEPVKESKPC
jgi:hemerythrin-like domain-containing protein